jgi:DNA-binding beta-propeller fold protein YncE
LGGSGLVSAPEKVDASRFAAARGELLERAGRSPPGETLLCGGNVMRNVGIFAVPVVAILLGLGTNASAGPTEYTLVKTIDLPGGKGGHGDWVTFDSATDTVWLAQAPDHAVVVIDAKTNRVRKVIGDIEEGNGIALSAHDAFLADGKGNKVVVVDKRSFAKVAELTDVGKTPDGLYWDERAGTLFVAADDDNQLTAFKSGKNGFKKIGSLKLEPNPAKDGPDVGILVASRGRIYQPVDNKIDVIDAKTMKIETVWDPGIKGSSKSIAYDPKTGHLVVGTTDKAVLIIDAANGKVIATIPVAGAVDQSVVDSGARRAYVGDKAGHVDVIDLDANTLIAPIPSDKDMHTLTVDPRTHAVYVYRDQNNKLDVFAAK